MCERTVSLAVRLRVIRFVLLEDVVDGSQQHKGDGDPVIKYGARIGTATQDIVPGEHVHLHNMRSDFDERASTLDAETALPEDVVYELY